LFEADFAFRKRSWHRKSPFSPSEFRLPPWHSLAALYSFFSQSAQGSKARKGISLRENCLRLILRLGNEVGIEKAHFRLPNFAFRLLTSHFVLKAAGNAYIPENGKKLVH
jgi:hypothetical protein